MAETLYRFSSSWAQRVNTERSWGCEFRMVTSADCRHHLIKCHSAGIFVIPLGVKRVFVVTLGGMDTSNSFELMGKCFYWLSNCFVILQTDFTSWQKLGSVPGVFRLNNIFIASTRSAEELWRSNKFIMSIEKLRVSAEANIASDSRTNQLCPFLVLLIHDRNAKLRDTFSIGCRPCPYV